MEPLADWDDEELMDGLVVCGQDSLTYLDRGLLDEHENVEAEIDAIKAELMRRLSLVR